MAELMKRVNTLNMQKNMLFDLLSFLPSGYSENNLDFLVK